MNSQIQDVTDRIIERSQSTRAAYLAKIDKARRDGPHRGVLSCGNLAHGFAASSPEDKLDLAGSETPNLAIINAYNDMLSAHQPYATYPDQIKQAMREMGCTAQVARQVTPASSRLPRSQ